MRIIKFYLLLLLSSTTSLATAQYQGPIPPITSGYGSAGSFEVDVVSISNDYFAERDISIFILLARRRLFRRFIFCMVGEVWIPYITSKP